MERAGFVGIDISQRDSQTVQRMGEGIRLPVGARGKSKGGQVDGDDSGASQGNTRVSAGDGDSSRRQRDAAGWSVVRTERIGVDDPRRGAPLVTPGNKPGLAAHRNQCGEKQGESEGNALWRHNGSLLPKELCQGDRKSVV